MPLRLPKRRPAILLTGLLAAGVAFAVSESKASSPLVPAIDEGAAAVLVVDGVDFEFELDTCFVGDDSFVVAGHGRQNDQDFRVLASPSEVELAFGVIDESAPVPEDSLWFGTKDSVAWSATQSRVTARLNLIERVAESEIEHEAVLRINCGAVS